MKQLIILSTILVTFFNCSVNEKPEFVGIETIKILESTPEFIVFTADALFINPNIIVGELQTDNIKVYVNDNNVASVSTEKFKVPAKKEFTIPLTANVPLDSIFGDANLSGLIGSLLNKKMKVQYKGDLIYTLLGFSFTYSLDETENIKIE